MTHLAGFVTVERVGAARVGPDVGKRDLGRCALKPRATGREVARFHDGFTINTTDSIADDDADAAAGVVIKLHRYSPLYSVCCLCVFFTFIDRVSTVPSKIYAAANLVVVYVVSWTGEDQRNIITYRAPTRA